MLAPHEFSVGPVALASGLTLVLRRHAHEASFLVTTATPEPIAVFLDGEHRFAFMPSAGNADWSGILVPNVTIEIDQTSVLDSNEGEPLGALVRKHSRLLIRAKRDPRMGASSVIVGDGLPPCHENESAAFARWQIGLGAGTSRRVLLTVDAAEK